MLAIGYFATGKLAYQLALPPASASPIWPAAGVALAGVVYWGSRVWPGIFLGALCVQLTERGALLEAGLFTLPALGILGASIGPVVQALAGSALIHRRFDAPTRIRRARDIFRRIWLGGPVACLVGALMGAASLFAMGLVSPGELGSTWLTWWFGDALGVFVVLPIALAWRSELRTLRPRAHAVVLVVLIGACLLSVLAYVSVRDREWEGAQASVDRRLLEMSDELRRVVDTKAELLYAVAKLHDVDRTMDLHRFRQFVRMDLARYGDMVAIGWVPVVEPDDLEKFVSDAQREYEDREFEVTELGDDGAPHPVTSAGETWRAIVQYIQPEQHNEAAIGFDLGSEVTRRKALERARNQKRPSATGPINLVQDEGARPAILLLAHCAHADLESTSTEAPDAFISGVFRTDEMIAKALHSFRQADLAFQVHDVTDPTRPRPLCLDPEGSRPPVDRGRHLAGVQRSQIAGRLWQIETWALPAYPEHPSWLGALGALAGGLLCTALLASLLILMTGNTVRAERSNRELRREVQERRTAEAALQKSERRFRDIVESTEEWIWEIDTQGQHVFTNNALSKILGYTAAEFDAHGTLELLHPRERESVRTRLERHIQDKTGWSSWVMRWRHKDGSFRFLESNAQPVLTKDGGLIGFRGADRDITERRLVHERMLQTQKMESLGVLAGGIAHDFNNLLTAIGGNIDFALNRPGQTNQEALCDAQRALERATGLTGQLLTFAKGGAPIVQTVDLRDLIQEWSRFALRGAKSSCDVHTPDDLWPARVDANQISQVLGNLIINADQAMPEGGLITVRARNTHKDPVDSVFLGEGRFVEISVQDQGPGIDPEIRSRIFDPYYTTKQDGTGLGLATVYSIVKRHGGHTLVDSEPGQGSTFHVYLPAAEAAAVASPAPSAKAGSPASGRVLVMDDAPFVRAFVSRALVLLGYEVELAASGDEAVELFSKAQGASRPFDIVILDLTVPGGMGGAEAVEHLRAVDPTVCAIASSGYSASPVMAKPDEYGFAGVIAKPYTIAQLEAVLGAALTTKQVGARTDSGRHS